LALNPHLSPTPEDLTSTLRLMREKRRVRGGVKGTYAAARSS
jgi:hypothetical protein